MGKNSAIEWCDHTFNIAWGCQKVSAECTHCYAETWAKRMGHGTTKPAIWGPGTPRRMLSDEYWRQPEKWNAEALKLGVRYRVFTSSMADVFEDHPEMVTPRDRLFELIQRTPELDWLVLTKRPGLMLEYLARRTAWTRDGFMRMWPNLWCGTTAGDPNAAQQRLATLTLIPSVVRFASMEPLLGPIDIRQWLNADPDRPLRPDRNALNWVIVGGESGAHSRPMHPGWVRDIRDATLRAGAAFFMKQWGEWEPAFTTDGPELDPFLLEGLTARERGDFVVMEHDGSDDINRFWAMVRNGKRLTGRTLDGIVWDEMPTVWRLVKLSGVTPTHGLGSAGIIPDGQVSTPESCIDND